ncbi:MAG: hypothetical protein ACAI44_40260, partial [Candidatus Sericytochromatia bacterium]
WIQYDKYLFNVDSWDFQTWPVDRESFNHYFSTPFFDRNDPNHKKGKGQLYLIWVFVGGGFPFDFRCY